MPAEQRNHRFHTIGESDFTKTVQLRHETNKQAHSKPWTRGRKQYADIVLNVPVSTQENKQTKKEIGNSPCLGQTSEMTDAEQPLRMDLRTKENESQESLMMR